MLKVIIYEKDSFKKARAILDLGYRTQVISWDVNLCAEILGIATKELLTLEVGTYKVKCEKCNK